MQNNSSVVSQSDDEGARARHSTRGSSLSLERHNMLGLLEDAPVSDASSYCRPADLERSYNAAADEQDEEDRSGGGEARRRPAPLKQAPSVSVGAHSGLASATQHWNQHNIRFLDRYDFAPGAAFTPSAASSASTASASPTTPSVALPRLSGANVQAVLQALLAERARADGEAELKLRLRLAQVNARAREQVAWAQNADQWAQETTEDFQRRLDIITAKEKELQRRERQVAEAWAVLHARGADSAPPPTARAASPIPAAPSLPAAAAAHPYLPPQTAASAPQDAPLSAGGSPSAKAKGRKPRAAPKPGAGAKRSIKETLGVRKTPVRRMPSAENEQAFFPKPLTPEMAVAALAPDDAEAEAS